MSIATHVLVPATWRIVTHASAAVSLHIAACASAAIPTRIAVHALVSAPWRIATHASAAVSSHIAACASALLVIARPTQGLQKDTFQDPGKVLGIVAWTPPDPDSFLVLSEDQGLHQPVAGIHLGIRGKPHSFLPYSDGVRFGSRTTFSCSPHSSRAFHDCLLLVDGAGRLSTGGYVLGVENNPPRFWFAIFPCFLF
jgi:hypothetical protein